MKRIMAGTNQKLLLQRFSPVEFTKPHNGLVSTKKTFSIAHILPWLCYHRPEQAACEENVFTGRGFMWVFLGLTLYKGPGVILWKLWN